MLGVVASALILAAVGFTLNASNADESATVAVPLVSEAAMTQAAAEAAANAAEGAAAVEEVEQRQWGLGTTEDVVPPRSAIRMAGTDTPKVALTFDDGPSAHTDDVLAILDRYGVKATFFVLGQNIKQDEDLVRRAAQNGHVIANHTWTHEAMPDMSDQQLKDELKGTSDEIARLVGLRPNLQRPPYGDFTVATNRVSRQFGMLTIGWNVDSDDWRTTDPRTIADNVLNAPGLGNGAIILLHDGGGDRTPTVEALPRILDGLRARGLEPVTLPELFRAAPPDPAVEGTLIDSTRPTGSGVVAE